jgi:hypothetical protein
MSLTLLVIIVVAGIAAVVIAVHMTGGSARATLDGEEAARLRFADDFPEVAPASVWLTRDGSSAIIGLQDGRVGIVHALGGKFLTRLVTADDLVGTPRASEGAVTLRLRDLTWHGGTLIFDDMEQARAVEATFAALRKAALWEKN